MECFRQIVHFIQSPFQRRRCRVLEIGPPTDFRKEELPSFFTDDDALTLHSRTALEKDAIVNATEQEQEPEPSTRNRIKSQVRRLSVKVSRPLSEPE